MKPNNNTAFIAWAFGVDAETLHQWRYELGLKFLMRQCHGVQDCFFKELEACKEYWSWFMYHVHQNDKRFMLLHADMVQHLCQYPTDSNKGVFMAAYKTHLQDCLKGQHMALSYAEFITPFVKSLQPVAVELKTKS